MRPDEVDNVKPQEAHGKGHSAWTAGYVLRLLTPHRGRLKASEGTLPSAEILGKMTEYEKLEAAAISRTEVVSFWAKLTGSDHDELDESKLRRIFDEIDIGAKASLPRSQPPSLTHTKRPSLILQPFC